MSQTVERQDSIGSAEIEARVAAYDWGGIAADLDAHGWAKFPRLLTHAQTGAIARLYGDDRMFRSRVVMARHGFGRGEYKYFTYPLPEIVANLRTATYPHLAPIANRWNDAMRIGVRFPPLDRGDGVVWAVRERPVQGTRGTPYRVIMRHGVSRLRSGHRHTLGIIFHDAK